MKLSVVFLFGLIVASNLTATGDHGVYYAELKAFKEAPATKVLFDEEVHSGLSSIQRDIITYKKLNSFHRWVRADFLNLDVIIVTEDVMPKLYAYIDMICQNTGIAVPTIFVTRQDAFFNAFAQKLLISTGGIVIGQKLLHDVSDEELEAIVAHEIGHIKHNHVNKMYALRMVKYLAYKAFCVYAIDCTLPVNYTKVDFTKVFAKRMLAYGITSLLPALIINKRFEKEADLFACEYGKSDGIIKFFERSQQKWQSREVEFDTTYDLLQQNKAEILRFGYANLILRYYMAKTGHAILKAWRYLYFNTFWGAHPSDQARIDAAKKYLEEIA